MQRIEVQHHTPQQVAENMTEAWRIVQESVLPENLYEVAFVEAYRLLAAKTVQAVAAPQGMFVPPMG